MTSSNSQTKKKQSFFVNMGDVLAKETEQAKSSVEEESWENREDADGASSVEESIIRDIQERLSLTVGASDDNYESDDSGTQCDCDACQQPILSIRNPHYNRVQEHWAKLRKFINIVYKQAGEGKPLDPAYEKQIQASIHELVTFEPHLLYKQLEAQIQEWVKETELRQLENLLDYDNVDNVPLRFISGLLESYKNLMTGADLAFPFLEELQATFLSKFNMTWQLLNEHIYQSCVYANPMVQNNVPIFIGKLSSTSESMESNKDLVKEFLYLDDNINSVSELWAECARCLDAACAQEERGQARRAQLEMEWKCFKEAGDAALRSSDMSMKMESCKRSKFAEDSSTNQSSNKCAMLACDCMTLSPDDVSHSLLSHPHTADSPHPPALPTAADHKTCPDGSCSGGPDYDMGHERVTPPSIRPCSPPTRGASSSSTSTPASHSHSLSPAPAPHSSTGVKGTNTSSLKQTTKAKTPPAADLAPSSSSSVVTKCRNKPPAAPQPGAPPPPRPSNCHKTRAGCSHHAPHSHRWESIKRVASCESHRSGGPPPPQPANYHMHNGLMTGPLDDEESDPCGGPGGGSCSSCTPPDDSASDQSSVSNQKSSSSGGGGGENRHCDCCYCEVFGHGVQSGAPVSRNYQEIRERLRLLLNKKKNSSKKAGAASSGESACSQHRSSVAAEPAKLPPGHRHLTTGTGTGPQAQNTQAQPPVFKGNENISDILNFIEGKTSKDSKKAAKKARQKEKKLQEMYQRKLEEEAAERAKLEAEKRRKLELLQEKERLIREQQRLERELQKQNQILNNNLKALSVKNNNNESNISNNSKKGKKAKQQQQQQQQNSKKQQQPVQQPPGDAASQKKNKKKNKKGDDPSPPAQESPSPVSPEEGEVPKIVTIKRVMETSGHEPTVTITLRGATPSEDKVLYTLQNGHVCPIEEKNRQAAAAAAAAAARSKKSGNKQQQQNKKQATVTQPKRPGPTHVQHTPGVVEINVNGGGGSSKPPVATVGAKPGAKPPPSAGAKKSAGPQPPATRLPPATAQPAPSFTSMSVVNVKASAPKPAPTPAPQLTSATAIQISQAISSLTSRGEGGPFSLEDLQLPPGITITKVVQPPHPLQPLVNGHHEENSAASSLSCDGGDSDNLNKENSNLGANAEAPLSKKSRKKRNKQKQQQLLLQQQNGEFIPNHSNPATANPPSQGAGEDSSAIIKVKGAMVSIRNPAVFPPGEVIVGGGGQKKTGGARHKDAASRAEEWNLVDEESVFAPKDIDLDNGDIDDAERELEAFKRFCSQSVPPKQKEKVHLNIKDIVLKKKRAAISCS